MGGQYHFLPVRISLITTLAATIAVNADAGVIRHDRADSLYTDLAMFFPTVGALTRDIGGGFVDVCSGTLINNPVGSGERWVLTAAHCLDHLVPASDFTFYLNDSGGGIHSGLETFIHPLYTGSTFTDPYDIALLRLATAETAFVGSVLNTTPNEVGKTFTAVGYGDTGTGLTGAVDFDWQKRAGTNVFDHDGTTVNLVSAFDPQTALTLYSDFDNPNGGEPFNMGSTTPTDLEFLTAAGDSGGGYFIDSTGLLPGDPGYMPVLAAVSSWGGTYDGFYDQDYGEFEGAVRVSQFADWINDTITMNEASAIPEPSSVVALSFGMIGFAGYRRRRTKQVS